MANRRADMGKSGEAHYAAGIAGAAFLTGLLTAWIGRKWLQKGVSALSEEYFDKILAMEFNYGGMFLYSLWENGKRLILYWMAQLTVFGLPCTVGVIAYTGMAGGLFAGVMAAEYGGRGILISAAYILPQAFFYVPAALISLSWGYRLNRETKNGSKLPAPGRLLKVGYIPALCRAFGLLAVGAAAEAFAGSLLLKKVLELFAG